MGDDGVALDPARRPRYACPRVVSGNLAEQPGTAATTDPVVRLEDVHKSFGD
jgi:hypothetical protein